LPLALTNGSTCHGIDLPAGPFQQHVGRDRRQRDNQRGANPDGRLRRSAAQRVAAPSIALDGSGGCRSAGRFGFAFEPFQIRPEIGGAAVAKLPILVERLQDDLFQPERDVRVDAGRRGRHPVQDLVEDQRRRLAVERRTAGGHLV
jgi:hypothetical protein